MGNEFFNFDVVVENEKKKSYNQALEDILNRCIEKDNCYVSIQQIRNSVKELKK